MWSNLLHALALVAIIEGLTPFLTPDKWREMMLKACHMDNKSLRLFGGIMVGVGLVILQLS